MLRQMTLAGAAAACFLLFAASARANPKDKYHGGALEARDHGYEHGYRDGFHRGADDRNRHGKYKLDHDEYKHADAGYESYMGNKDNYRTGYRQGFQSGYDDGFYARQPRFGEIYGPLETPPRGSADRSDDIYSQRHWGGSDVAYDIGYRDGLTAGNTDFRDHRSFHPEDRDDYRSADHGYRPSYGDADTYRRRYRDGFTQGYRDGYENVR